MITKAHHPIHAILYALGGYSLWVVGDTFIKLAVQNGVPRYEVMVIGGLAGMLTILAYVLGRGRAGLLRVTHPKPLAFLGLLFFANYIVWVTALANLPLANFYTIVFLAPTVASIFAALFMKEKLETKRIIAIIVGFIGVVIAVKPEHIISDKADRVSYALAFMGMCVVVTQMLTMRRVSDKATREAMAFYPRIAAIVGGIALTLLNGFALPTAIGSLYAIGAGLFGAIGWMLMAQAWKMAPLEDGTRRDHCALPLFGNHHRRHYWLFRLA